MSLILVGIGVAIGLVICRGRSRPQPGREGLDDFTTPTYVAAQRIEPRIRYAGDGRRRSQRTSLYLEESRNGGYTARRALKRVQIARGAAHFLSLSLCSLFFALFFHRPG